MEKVYKLLRQIGDPTFFRPFLLATFFEFKCRLLLLNLRVNIHVLSYTNIITDDIDLERLNAGLNRFNGTQIERTGRNLDCLRMQFPRTCSVLFS